MPIVRPARSRAARLAHSDRAIPASCASSAAKSEISRSNVRSRDSETTLRAAPTGASDSKRARRARSRPWLGPKLFESSSSGAPATAASVCRPSPARRPAVFGPMPGMSPGGEDAKRAHAASRSSTTKPAGFSASEATFATSLFGPIPTEHVSPIFREISATRRRSPARATSTSSSPRAARAVRAGRGTPRRGRPPRRARRARARSPSSVPKPRGRSRSRAR